MALNFNATSGYVNHGSGASLDDLPGTAISCVAWIYRTADGANQQIITKDNSFPSGFGFLVDPELGTEGTLRCNFYRATTTADSISGSSDVVPLNTWTFVAATYAPGTAPKLFIGSLTSQVAEVSAYGRQIAGAGAYLSDAAASLYVGNLQRTTSVDFNGRIARAGVWNRELSLGELQALQHSWVKTAGCVLLTDYHGTGTQPDLSGSGNNGTVTLATAADHVPLKLAWQRAPAPTFAVTAGGVSAAALSASGVGSSTATGRTIVSFTIAAAGTGSLAGTGQATAGATLAGSGTGALAIGSSSIAGATLAGAGTGVFAGANAAIASGSLSGAGTGTAAYTASIISGAALSAAGVGTTAPSGASLATAALTAAGTGQFTVTGSKLATAALSGSGLGTMAGDSTTGGTVVSGALGAAGVGSLTGAGIYIVSGVLAGSGAGSAASAGGKIGTGAFSGAGSGAANDNSQAIVGAALVGQGAGGVALLGADATVFYPVPSKRRLAGIVTDRQLIGNLHPFSASG